LQDELDRSRLIAAKVLNEIKAVFARAFVDLDQQLI